MRLFIISLFSAALTASATSAAPRGDVAALYRALMMPEVIEIMRSEGVAYGKELRDDMFPGRGGVAWSTVVNRLYDAEAMDAAVFEKFDELLAEVEVTPLVTYFLSDPGAKIVGLEVEARRTIMDDDAEAAARGNLAEMRASADPRIAVLETFVSANDLVESNVVGAMNSSYAFYNGLMVGGALDGELTEDRVLADVWAQEPEIRSETTDWVYSYLALAYEPLADADIEAYTALSLTREGRALNHAIFGAFDAMYTTISFALGQGAARFMVGEEL